MYTHFYPSFFHSKFNSNYPKIQLNCNPPLIKKITNHGHILEADLEYPIVLWDLHDDYPLALEKMRVNNVEKLHGNLFPKYHYVIH